MRIMSQETVTETIVERVDGIRVDSAEISGIAEVEAYIDETELPDEIDEVRSWLENAVEDYIEKELSQAGHRVYCEARASDITDDDPILHPDIGPNESKYSVWVQFQ
jgi:predicted AAA+ superfamily ATPase